ncbi:MULTISPECIES: DUF2934 domain-containing protein [unclassified Rhizobium]|uniref:DUF2934 domain-containing protein n=1 Tax=unclassified Rhizobium TaxID=2613769 RepID=UPI003823304F
MADERFEWISKRAYSIWEAAGRPSGTSELHWEQAAKEWDMKERTKASADGREVLVMRRGGTRPDDLHDGSGDTSDDSRRFG